MAENLTKAQDRISTSRWPIVLAMLIIAIAAALLYGQEVAGASTHLTQQLGSAFLEGHAYLDVTPNPKLLALANPYDPVQNGLLRFPDASLYQGKYYLYFGPVPAIILWVPVKLFTGISLEDADIIYIFSTIGAWSTCLLLYFISRQRGFGSDFGCCLGMVSLCFGVFIPSIITFTKIYEVAATGGYCFTALGILALWPALRRQKNLWMGLASLMLGLAVGCRISLGLNIIILAAAAFYLRTRTDSGKSFFASLGALFIPWGMCLLGLAAYNYVRFGSFLETGFYYQLSSFNYQNLHFSIFDTKRALPKAYFYFLKLLPWENIFSFPFFYEPWRPIMKIFWRMHDPVPLTQEGVFGLFANTPFSLWVFPALWNIFRAGWSGALRTLLIGVTAYATATAVFLIFYFYSTLRYGLDFTPWFVLVAAVGYMYQLQHCKTRGYYYCLIVLGTLAVVYSTYSEILLGLACLHASGH